MTTSTPHRDDPFGASEELRNLREIVEQIVPQPGDIPVLEGIDIYGRAIPLNGVGGGDHVIYVDFKKRYDLDARIRRAAERSQPAVVDNLERCRRMAGVAVIDVAGHQATDVMLAAMMHQAFLLGSLYELDTFGHITKRIFENLNTRFYNSSSVSKFVTMLYGEISEDATFRFVTAAHPFPIVFSSAQDGFMEIPKACCTTFPPIGTLPSSNVIDRNATESVLGFKDQYELNEWSLMGSGDILLLCPRTASQSTRTRRKATHRNVWKRPCEDRSSVARGRFSKPFGRTSKNSLHRRTTSHSSSSSGNRLSCKGCCTIQPRRGWGRFPNLSFTTPRRRISAYPSRPSG